VQTRTKSVQALSTSSLKGEVMRTAQRLIKTRGPDALAYANRKAEVMKEREFEKEDIAFWQKISKQVELLLDSDDYS